MFKFITHKPLWVNLLAMVGAVLLIFILFFSSLGIITRHSSNVVVPSVIGKSADEATQTLEAAGYEVSIQDSAYIDTLPPQSVIRQSPEGGDTVKMHRMVYLVVNRAVAPMIDMPDLRNFSYKSAELYLKSLGLKVGDTSYTPDVARNAVKQQLLNGEDIAPGTKVAMGSAIKLVLGDGKAEDELNVPDLVGMTVQEARLYLSNKSLSIGAISSTEALRDTANAFIGRQSPQPFSTLSPGEIVANKMKAGQTIDIWISIAAPIKNNSDSSQPATDQ